ncbi:MAG: bifunctional folylpolyglutamate synthase/dihydrofolate synthase [Sphingopyxis sp.]|nr:bifunctional folylpolyglutamate synthase/dihydrofolate synthase [Sphingopyxis sp.]
MADHASSENPAVRAQLDRLSYLSPGRDVLGLGRITALLDRIDNPHHRLPPVFHVAGTNGKGSTAAFLRAALEAAGHRVHAYTSPHLVRFNERIRVAGSLIEDAALAALLAEVLDASGDIAPSFFEATTAAAFLAFARIPADAAIIEVGLGGRLDATNVIAAPLVAGIASLGIDHREFLLAPEAGTPSDPLARIAFEKAGIAKKGVPLVTLSHSDTAAIAIAEQAKRVGAPLLVQGRDWEIGPAADHHVFRDKQGSVFLPQPALSGVHQLGNAGLAVAMLRAQSKLPVDPAALSAAMLGVRWPGRLQRLGPGPLTAQAPLGELWLDGGHNVDAAQRIADFFARDLSQRGPVDLIIGMLANKDLGGFLAAMAPVVRALVAVPVTGHAHHTPEAITALAKQHGIRHLGQATDVSAALGIISSLARKERKARGVAIMGSLYLAGDVLRLNDEVPD